MAHPTPPPVIYDRASAEARYFARNLAAEVRALEEGHNCRLDTARGLFLVKSDTSDRTYELTAVARDGRVVVSCTCPAGVKRHIPDGHVGCKHSALVCRRLSRAGLARFDGRVWVATEKALEAGQSS